MSASEGYCWRCKQPRVWHVCAVCDGRGIEDDDTYPGVDDPDGPFYMCGVVECSGCSGDGGEYRCPTCNSGGRAARRMAEESGALR